MKGGLGKGRNEQWDMNWLSSTITVVKDCVNYPGISYWARAVRDIANNSLHAKHVKDPLRDSLSLSFQPSVWFYRHHNGKNQLQRGCTAQSTLQRQNKSSYSTDFPATPANEANKVQQCERLEHSWGSKMSFVLSHHSYQMIFFLLNHILWLKSWSLLRASSRTHSSFKKATNQTHKTTWKPSFLELQRNPVWIHLWQLTAAKLHTDSSSCSENPAAFAFGCHLMICMCLQMPGSLW